MRRWCNDGQVICLVGSDFAGRPSKIDRPVSGRARHLAGRQQHQSRLGYRPEFCPQLARSPAGPERSPTRYTRCRAVVAAAPAGAGDAGAGAGDAGGAVRYSQGARKDRKLRQSAQPRRACISQSTALGEARRQATARPATHKTLAPFVPGNSLGQGRRQTFHGAMFGRSLVPPVCVLRQRCWWTSAMMPAGSEPPLPNWPRLGQHPLSASK